MKREPDFFRGKPRGDASRERATSVVRFLSLLPLLFLAACAGSLPAPDWQAGAHAALARHVAAYLKGDTRLAETEFVRARSELARTGRAELVARAELTRCAVHLASLATGPDASCPGFAALADDAGEAERAYADFLSGRAVMPSLLPAQYRALGGAGEAALPGIEHPLSRLVAAGVLHRTGRLSSPGVEIAVATASAEGWRRPLLAWLEVQAQLAEARDDPAAAAHARRRAALVTGER